MSEISRFYGIIITMNFSDHNPPHFHARFGNHKVVIDIKTGGVLAGNFPPRALGMVSEWQSLHVAELMSDWELAQKNQMVQPIKPLE